MKNKTIIIIGILFASLTMSAQIGVDKATGFGASALLEFGNEARGIRLMPVTDATTLTASAGTIVFDGTTGSFRYYNGTVWSSVVTGGCAPCGAPTVADDSNQGVILGENTSVAQGVLILGKDTGETKGLVLPNVNLAEAKIPSPPIGLMVYDTSSETVKVYNGVVWTHF